MQHLTRFILGLLVIISLDQCKQPSVLVPANTTPTRDDNMEMGNPDGAKESESSPLIGLNPDTSVGGIPPSKRKHNTTIFDSILGFDTFLFYSGNGLISF